MMRTIKSIAALLVITASAAFARVHVDAVLRHGQESREFHGILAPAGEADVANNVYDVISFEHEGRVAACTLGQEGDEGVTLMIAINDCGEGSSCELPLDLPWGEEVTFDCPDENVDASLTIKVTRID